MASDLFADLSTEDHVRRAGIDPETLKPIDQNKPSSPARALGRARRLRAGLPGERHAGTVLWSCATGAAYPPVDEPGSAGQHPAHDDRRPAPTRPKARKPRGA